MCESRSTFLCRCTYKLKWYLEFFVVFFFLLKKTYFRAGKLLLSAIYGCSAGPCCSERCTNCLSIIIYVYSKDSSWQSPRSASLPFPVPDIRIECVPMFPFLHHISCMRESLLSSSCAACTVDWYARLGVLPTFCNVSCPVYLWTEHTYQLVPLDTVGTFWFAVSDKWPFNSIRTNELVPSTLLLSPGKTATAVLGVWNPVLYL